MTFSTGSRELDYSLGVGEFAPQLPSFETPPAQAPQAPSPAQGLLLPPAGPVLNTSGPVGDELIDRAAQKYGVPPRLIQAVMHAESRGNARAKSPKGAMGLMQLMPGTAADYGVRDPYDPEQNVMGGTAFLRDLLHRYHGDERKAVMAYNAGPGRIDKGIIPHETADYVTKVMGYMGNNQAPMPNVQPRQAQPQPQVQPQTNSYGLPITPAPEGFEPIWLSTGVQLNIPKGMDYATVTKNLANNEDPQLKGAVPTVPFNPGDGNIVMIPYNFSQDEARHHLVNQGELADRTGGWHPLQHAVSEFERTLAHTADYFKQWPLASKLRAAADAGDWTTYDSEVKAAAEKGWLPGAAMKVYQKLVEPLFGVAGSIAPALMTAPIVGAAAPALGPIVGAASLYPSSVEEIKQYGRDVNRPVSDEAASLLGVPYAAIMGAGLPIKGAARVLGLKGAEEMIPGLVQRGMTEEAERLVGGAGSRVMDAAKAYAGNVGANVAQMEAIDAIKRGAAGESLLPPEERQKEILEQAAWFGAPHALASGMMSKGRREDAFTHAMMQEEERNAALHPETRSSGRLEAGPVSEPVPEPTAVPEERTPTMQEEEAISRAWAAEGGTEDPATFAARWRQERVAAQAPPEALTAPETISPEARYKESMAQLKALQDTYEQTHDVEELRSLHDQIEQHKLATAEIYKEWKPESKRLPAELRPKEFDQPASPFNQEQDNAQQKSQAGEDDGSGQSQSSFRQESGDTAEGSQGFQSSGQGKQPPQESDARSIQERIDEAVKTGQQFKLTPKELNGLPKEDQLYYHTYHGDTDGEISKKMGISKDEVFNLRNASDIWFSKGERGEGVTKEALQKHLRDRYGPKTPNVEIKSSQEAGVSPQTKAFYDTNTKRVTLVHDNLGASDDIHGLLKHEVGVHAQRLGQKDPEFQGILKHMQSLRDRGVKVVQDAYKRVPESTKESLRDEEALGYLVQHHKALPLVQRFFSWLRRMAHKLTGNAGWLKPEDLSEMARGVLSRDYSRPDRPEVRGEQLKSEEKDDILHAITTSGLIKQEKTRSFAEQNKKIYEDSKHTATRFRQYLVDKTDPLTRKISELASVRDGKLRADFIAAQTNQAPGFITTTAEMGKPIITESGASAIQPSNANLKYIVEDALKHDPHGDTKLNYVLTYEVRKDIHDNADAAIERIKKLDKEIAEIELRKKYFEKTNKDVKLLKAAEKELADKQFARKQEAENNRIDLETMQGPERLITPEQDAIYERLMQDSPWLKNSTQLTREMLHGLVDYYQQAGMIDKEKAARWNSFRYAPLYKALEDLEKDPDFGQSYGRSAEFLNVVKELKGHSMEVNMLENLHKHYYVMMLPAMFNHTRRVAMEDILHLDALYRQRENPGLSYEEAFRRSTKQIEKYAGDKNTTQIRIDGEARHFRIEDPDLLEMLAFNNPARSAIANFFMPMATLQRTAFLKQPVFWAKQLFWDPLYANFMSGVKPVIHPGHAVANLLKIWAGKNEDAKVLEKHGIDVGWHDFAGEKAFSFKGAGEPSQYHELFGKKSGWNKLGNTLDRIHNSIDEAVRTSVYQAALKDGRKQGMTGQTLEDWAVHKARTYINFSARGSNQFFNEWRSTIAFTSAAINSLDSIMKQATGYGLNAKEASRAKKMFWTRAMAVMGSAMAYEIALQSAGAKPDDENIEQRYPTIKLGDSGLKLTAPWDIGTFFVSLPRIFVDTFMLNAHDKNHRAFEQGAMDAFRQVRDNVLPPFPIPSGLKSVVESLSNYDYRSWSSIEGPGSQRYRPEDRGNSNTIIGDWFGHLTGLSGKRADHFGKSMGGWMYDLANWSLGLADSTHIEKPKDMAQKLRYTGVGQFLTAEAPGVDQLYQASDLAEQYANSFNKAKKEQDKARLEELQKDPESLAYRRSQKMLKDFTTTLNSFSPQAERIRNSTTLSEQAKQEKLKTLKEQRDSFARMAKVRMNKALGDYAP